MVNVYTYNRQASGIYCKMTCRNRILAYERRHSGKIQKTNNTFLHKGKEVEEVHYRFRFVFLFPIAY